MTTFPTAFDQAIAAAPTGDPAVFTAHLQDEWSSLAGMHGGYACAVAVRAMEAGFDEGTTPPRLRALSATFLRGTQPGPAEVHVEVLRRGRRLSVQRARIVQDGKDRVLVQGTFAAPMSGLDVDHPSLAKPDPANRRRFETGGLVKHFENFDVDLDRRWWPGGDGELARLSGWIRLKEQRPLDDALVALVADVLPPTTFAASATPQGGMTLDLAVTLLADPGEAAVVAGTTEITMTVETEHAEEGMGWERGVLWVGDRVVAAVTQTRYLGRAPTALSTLPAEVLSEAIPVD
jgi:acyl-CoA thioesterase